VIVAATVVGLAGYAADFPDGAYILPSLGGLLVGGAVAWLGARLRLSALLTAIAGVAAFFLLGTPFTMPAFGIAAVVPTAKTLSGLAIGSVQGWADIVTLRAPIEAPYYLTVIPFATAWLASLVGCSLAFRWLQTRPRTPGRSLVALTPAIVVYATTVLIGTHDPFLPVVRGVILAALALVWIAWRQPTSANSSAKARRAQMRQRVVGTAIVAGGAIVAATLVGGLVTPPEDERFVLRDEVAPPFEPHDFPSPLSGFRHYTKDVNEEALFTVTGLEPGETIRIATMDTYDGKLWDVTSGGLFADASGTFELVGVTLPEADARSDGELRAVTIDVLEYSDIWVPLVGQPSAIEFADGADIDSTALRYNAGTRTGVVTTGLESGMSYTLTVSTVVVPTDEQLAGVAVAQVDQPPVGNVPSIVSGKAEEYGGEAQSPLLALRAIEHALKDKGFLSHGSGSDSAPSLAGHGADRLTSMFEKSVIVGDQEQYAAAFALMARELGYPARVVMGFAPEVTEVGGTVSVTGDDVTAWVEVPFEGYGWVPFFPTPDQTDVPRDEEPQPRAEPQPQVRQPPRSDDLQEETGRPVQIEEPEDEEDEEEAPGIPAWVWTALIALAIPVVLYTLPWFVLALAKARRRSRRRSRGPDHERAAGAWDEVEDSYAELGYSISPNGTRIDRALDFEDQFSIEVAARAGEMEAVRKRAAAKTAAKVAQLEERQQVAEVKSPMLAFREATVLRAKQAGIWHPGVAESDSPLPVLAGLRELAVDADWAVFSGKPVTAEHLESVWRASDEARAAARKSVSWTRREIGKFRYRFRPGRTASIRKHKRGRAPQANDAATPILESEVPSP
jgi:hypothetical protein